MNQPIMKTALRDYLKRSNLEESSVEVLRRAVRWFIDMHGDIKMEDVTFGHVDDFRSWLLKGRAGSTANTYTSMLKGMFRWLRDRGHIRANPFDGLKKCTENIRQFDIYSPEEVGRILRVADLRWRIIVCLALCSMRRTEILNLVVSDIDFEKNEIHLMPKSTSATTWPWSIKNHNEAYIGIDDTISRMLIELSEQLGPQLNIILKKNYWERNLRLQAAGTLSHRLRNNPWGNFNRDFSKLLMRAQVPHKRFHDYRRTFATERYNDGFDIRQLKYLLRHSSIQTTERYIQEIEEKKLIARSSRAFKKFYETMVL